MAVRCWADTLLRAELWPVLVIHETCNLQRSSKHLLHINLCQIIMFDQGRVIPYFGDVPVTFVEPLGPLVSPNKTTPRTLASHHTKFVDKFQV